MQFYSLLIKKAFFVIIFVFVINRVGCAALYTTYNYDTLYVKGFRKTISVTACGLSKLLNINVQNGSNSNQLKLRPSPYASFGVELDTKLWSLSFNPGFLTWNSNSEKYGKTNQYDTKLLINLNPFICNFTFQLYNGYYLKNASDYNQTQRLQEYYKQNNLQAITFGINAYYVFNYKKFALMAPYNYTTSQIKSSGSFVGGFTYDYFDLKNDSGMIHPIIKNDFDSLINFKSANSHYYTGNFGYGYTFVIKKQFYISATYISGIGVDNFNYYMNDTTYIEKKRNFALQSNLRFGAGWDDQKWFCGVNGFYNDYYISGLSKSLIEFDKVAVKLFVGRRFSTARIHNKIISKLKKRLDDI